MDEVLVTQSDAGGGGLPRRRPVWVWVITIVYVLSAGFTLVSLALILSGAIPLTPAQQQYFSAVGPWDHVATVGVALLTLTGTVLLFLLRRAAVPAFSAGLLLNVGYTIVHAQTTTWATVIGKSGLVGTVIAWVILGAVISYSRRLREAGVLR